MGGRSERREKWVVQRKRADDTRAGGVELGKREFLKCHFEEFLGPDGKGTAGV